MKGLEHNYDNIFSDENLDCINPPISEVLNKSSGTKMIEGLTERILEEVVEGMVFFLEKTDPIFELIEDKNPEPILNNLRASWKSTTTNVKSLTNTIVNQTKNWNPTESLNSLKSNITKYTEDWKPLESVDKVKRTIAKHTQSLNPVASINNISKSIVEEVSSWKPFEIFNFKRSTFVTGLITAVLILTSVMVVEDGDDVISVANAPVKPISYVVNEVTETPTEESSPTFVPTDTATPTYTPTPSPTNILTITSSPTQEPISTEIIVTERPTATIRATEVTEEPTELIPTLGGPDPDLDVHEGLYIEPTTEEGIVRNRILIMDNIYRACSNLDFTIEDEIDGVELLTFMQGIAYLKNNGSWDHFMNGGRIGLNIGNTWEGNGNIIPEGEISQNEALENWYRGLLNTDLDRDELRQLDMGLHDLGVILSGRTFTFPNLVEFLQSRGCLEGDSDDLKIYFDRGYLPEGHWLGVVPTMQASSTPAITPTNTAISTITATAQPTSDSTTTVSSATEVSTIEGGIEVRVRGSMDEYFRFTLLEENWRDIEVLNYNVNTLAQVEGVDLSYSRNFYALPIYSVNQDGDIFIDAFGVNEFEVSNQLDDTEQLRLFNDTVLPLHMRVNNAFLPLLNSLGAEDPETIINSLNDPFNQSGGGFNIYNNYFAFNQLAQTVLIENFTDQSPIFPFIFPGGTSSDMTFTYESFNNNPVSFTAGGANLSLFMNVVEADFASITGLSVTPNDNNLLKILLGEDFVTMEGEVIRFEEIPYIEDFLGRFGLEYHVRNATYTITPTIFDESYPNENPRSGRIIIPLGDSESVVVTTQTLDASQVYSNISTGTQVLPSPTPLFPMIESTIEPTVTPDWNPTESPEVFNNQSVTLTINTEGKSPEFINTLNLAISTGDISCYENNCLIISENGNFISYETGFDHIPTYVGEFDIDTTIDIGDQSRVILTVSELGSPSFVIFQRKWDGLIIVATEALQGELPLELNHIANRFTDYTDLRYFVSEYRDTGLYFGAILHADGSYFATISGNNLVFAEN